MSFLDKLSIQGIRSFDSKEPVVLQFYPLTIILGPNGAGKTSIIEALKYVTTGQTPANSGGGKTFILDPIVANSPTVRAQVKLRFTDIEKKMSVITRSIELNAKRVKGKKTSLSFKSLNSVIKRDDKQLDQRCADINNEMLDLLGVSKAVLTNVIFCHQEDCNWPLSEAKVLKDKFDDIFGSMAYVKALDKIKKLRQKELSDQKLLEKDVNHSKIIKTQSDNKKKELKNYQNQLTQLKTYRNDSEAKVSSFRAELSVIVGKEESIQSITNQINLIKGSLHEKQKNLDQLKTNIKTPFVGTEDELKSQIENFGSNDQKIEEKQCLLIQEKDLHQNYSKLIQSQQNLNKDLTKLQISEENHKRLLEDRNQLVLKMFDDSIVSIDSNIIDKINSKQMLESVDINVVDKRLDEELIKCNNDLSNRRNADQQSSDQLIQQLNDFKSTLSKYEHEVDLWQTDQKNKLKTLNDLKTRMNRFSKSNAEYETINARIQCLTQEIKQLQSFDVEDKKRDNQRKESEKKSLKNEINLMEEKLKELRQQNDQRIKFEILKKDKTEREVKVRQINEIHRDVMQTVGAIEGQFHSSLSNHIQTLSAQIDKIWTEISKKENELTSEMTKTDIKNESLKNKRKELKEMESKLKKNCKLDEYESLLTTTDTELKDLRHRLSEMTSYQPFLKTQIQTIESKNSCPVCERDVNDEWIAKSGNKLNKKVLIRKLESDLSQTPDSVEELQRNIKCKEEAMKELIGLGSVVVIIKSLNSEIPKLLDEINSSNDDIERQRNFIQKEKMKLNKQKSELNSLRDVLQDANECDNNWEEIQDLNKKINSMDLSSDCDSDSIEDMNNDLQLKKDLFDEIEAKISANHKIIVEHSDNYNRKQNDLQNCERNKLEIERHEHEMTSYKQKFEELEQEISVLDQNITDSTLKSMDLKPKITEIEDQIKEAKNESKEIEELIQIKIYSIKEKQKEMEKMNKEIDFYLKSGKCDEMRELSSKLTDLKNDIKNVETERQTMTTDINRLSEEISCFNERKRELKDNLLAIELESEINVKNNQLRAEEERLVFGNYQELKSKKRELEIKLKNEESVLLKAEGKQMPIIDMITRIEREMRSEPLKSADTNFKKSCIDLAISEISGEDLNKYYKALDFAVSEFHRKKIEEINKWIKGFWGQAYRGLDIDYIKIVSDETERSANDKRRTYDYRVVMVKGDIEMDMRGRCSAGQKVLASLVIRLALAEIFCHNCSVLALDEPTTNLDKENIESFAIAITEIVKYKKKSFKDTNFQLIIITHDEEFLQCLDAETGEYYYNVFKNDFGFSKVLRKSIAENNSQ